MENHNRKAFIYSLVLHGIFFAVLFMGIVMQWLKPHQEERQVFELFTPSEDRPGPPDKKKGPKIKAPVAEHEVVEPIKQLDPGKVPEIPKTPDPVPEPEPDPEPSPKPQPPQPATAKPKPVDNPDAPKKVVKDEPKKKQPKMTVAEFQKKFGNPSDNKKKPTTTKKPRTVLPTIDTGEILRKLKKAGGGDGGGTGGAGPGGYKGTEWENWVRAVHISARDQWEDDKPQDLMAMNIQADVTFDVSTYGVISNIRIVRGSGYRRFDDAVVQSLRSLGRVTPPPGRESVNASLTFEMKDE